MQAPSVIEPDESAVVEWLFRSSPVIRPLFGTLSLPVDSTLGVCVQEPVLIQGERPGDVDVLSCDAETPHLATAIECKRVKVPAHAFATGLPNKLGDIRKGVNQATALAAHQFHRTILLIIAQVDGRERAGPFWARGLTPELLGMIRKHESLSDLPPEVGVALVELTQPADKPIFDAGAVPMKLLVPAAGVVQPAPLTNRIRAWIQIRQHGT